jgi:transposase
MVRLTIEQVMILLLNNQLDEKGIAFGSRRIAAIIGRNYSTICRWINRWERERERRVYALKPKGKTCKTTEEQDFQIVALSIVMRFANLTELLAQLPEVHVCKAAFSSRLQEQKLRFRISA